MSDEITGRKLTAADGRSVALYDLGDEWALRFALPGEGETGIRLTHKAMMALVRLYIEAHDADAAFIEDGAVRFGRSA